MAQDMPFDRSAVIFRAIKLEDAPSIRIIRKYYIDNTCYSWSYVVPNDEYYYIWVQQHQTATRPAFVATYHDQVIGFSSLSDFRSHEGYWPCAEDSVYVLPEYIGQGIGQALMRLIIDQAKSAGLKAVIAGIDGENQESIRFHQKFGFQICGTLKDIGWKNDTWRTLVLMQLDLF